MQEQHVLDTLHSRGFVANISDEESLRRVLSAGPVTVYCGYDPTGSSLHVGHLVSIMLLAHLRRGGHYPLVVVGGGTGMIGDPKAAGAARPLLSQEQIAMNLAGIQRQFSRYFALEEGEVTILNNADWLLPLHWIDFLRDIGRHFTINQLLQHETYRERLEKDSLSFIEINYALSQAYDFLHLYRERGCRLQVGGNDQWFNILSGVDLVRRAEGAQVFALTSPLLTTSSGQKMGKTEAGAVWLDATLTTPYDYYQFWRNTEDMDVGRFLRLFTFLPLEDIAALEALQGAEINEAKDILAFEATCITHGMEEAHRAQETARARFRGEGEDFGPSLTVAPSSTLIDVLVESGLSASRGDARRQLKGGGVRLNGTPQLVDRVLDAQELPSLLSVGKRRTRLIPA